MKMKQFKSTRIITPVLILLLASTQLTQAVSRRHRAISSIEPNEDQIGVHSQLVKVQGNPVTQIDLRNAQNVGTSIVDSFTRGMSSLFAQT